MEKNIYITQPSPPIKTLELDIHEVQEKFEELVDDVVSGKFHLVILVNGKPAARMIPYASSDFPP